MLDFPRWKVWLVIATTFIGLMLAVPSLLGEGRRGMLPGGWSENHINLGLDLAGGSQLLMEANIDDVKKHQFEVMQDRIEQDMRRAEPKIDIGDVAITPTELSFMVRDAKQVDKAVDLANAQTKGVGALGQRDWSVSVRDGATVVMQLTDAGLKSVIDEQMDTARSIVARRVDESGTKEASVTRQGDDRLLVQVPGEKDPERLKRLIGKTAKLEFKMVDLTADMNEALQGRAPIGSQVLLDQKKKPVVVKRRAIITGDDLSSAQQSFDGRDGSPVVSLQFNGSGGKKFARATTENVGKPFAIVLDDVVITAPKIESPIINGSGQIQGGFTTDSANELAITLRSGKLPVALRVMEENTVSPELGQDSINKGVLAGILATCVLIFYMLITYFRFGVYTTIALLVNALLVLGLMGIFNATLTLPGIAGFVLTIGAAVDANVLINERIREEMRRGRNTLTSVEFGYKEASRAIFDANITNVISAIILFWFGSGPIKGFAIVLALGIFTSVFTGVTLTRLLVADYLRRARPKTLTL
jgi:preprotein translocase subunit SecD